MTRLELRQYPKLFKRTFVEFIDDSPMTYCAALSYYTIFSLPGILILVLYVAGIFLGEEAISGELMSQAEGLLGSDAAAQIQDIMIQASSPAKGWLMKLVGILTLIVSATTAFTALQQALNAMWEVRAKPEKGWLRMIILRLLSLAMIASMGFIVLVSLAADAILGVLRDQLQMIFPQISVGVMYVLNLGFSLVLFTFVFALIFKVLPDAKVKWRDVWFGSIFTSFLFIIGKFLIGFYLGKSDFSGTYGAAGSLVIILAWVYYASLILLFGAELTQVYANMNEGRIEPADHAVKIKVSEVELE